MQRLPVEGMGPEQGGGLDRTLPRILLLLWLSLAMRDTLMSQPEELRPA